MPLDYKIIGKNIQTRRKKKNVTQQQMADDLYLSASLISKVERGIKAVSLDTFQAIADYLNTNILILISDPDKPEVYHDILIEEINAVLEKMDNRELTILSRLMQAYFTQVSEKYEFPENVLPEDSGA